VRCAAPRCSPRAACSPKQAIRPSHFYGRRDRWRNGIHHSIQLAEITWLWDMISTIVIPES
jgi:hypothetical protein